ncbi:unnamed protein product [Auanema sp. JU1783]|nr:unnamed protein product [Auanema sp. JU1783]
MLGMMNSPSDGVEFYSTNTNKNAPQLNEEDRKTFTEVKERDVVTYTEDGRRLINGKTETIDPKFLWGSTLLRGHVKVILDKEELEKAEEEKLEASKHKSDVVQVVDPPVLAQTQTSHTSEDTPSSSAHAQ